MLSRKVVPIEVVMAQVGHISAEMTRYYTHLGTRARERAAAAVEHRNTNLLAELKAPAASDVASATGTFDNEPSSSRSATATLDAASPAEQASFLPAELLTKLLSISAEKLAALLTLLQRDASEYLRLSNVPTCCAGATIGASSGVAGAYGRGGKPKAGFPTAPTALGNRKERDSHIPTAATRSEKWKTTSTFPTFPLTVCVGF
jgi:hypothetical protein